MIVSFLPTFKRGGLESGFEFLRLTFTTRRKTPLVGVVSLSVVVKPVGSAWDLILTASPVSCILAPQ